MNAKTAEWRPGPSVCRCCLSEGCYKDISTEYFWMGRREVYAEMLSDTFDLTVAYSKSSGPNSNSRLICEPCIARLRDAADFKRQVQECERTFLQHLDPSASDIVLEVTAEPLEKAVKMEECEPVKEENAVSDDDIDDVPDFGDDDDDDLDDQPLTRLASKTPKKETMDISDLLDNAKAAEKRKSSTKTKGSPAKKAKTKKDKVIAKPKPEKKKKVSREQNSRVEDIKLQMDVCDNADRRKSFAIDGDENDGNSLGQTRNFKKNTTVANGLYKIAAGDKISHIKSRIENNEDIDNSRLINTEKDRLKISDRRGNGPILRGNSLKLLANSTMCVFQWNKSRYRCFCCNEPFSNMNLLREHTKNKHTLQNIEKKIISQQNRLVKVEISILFCKICETKLENIPILRNHLTIEHKIDFELDEDLLVPFKIEKDSLKCQLCFENFRMFRLLNIHMNKHYQKQVCHICGAGFSNLVFLNLHKTRSHRPFHCKECDLTFKNRIDKRRHDVTEHNVKFERKLRFPCPYCQERFFQENFRVQHLVEKHGMERPEHKCTFCSKTFITRSLCNHHVKSVHMKEKRHECDICHNVFYTKYDVSRHRVTHTGEKKFCCTLCNNLFATKDSLRRHMKRTHVL